MLGPCLAHGRRKFVPLDENFPAECRQGARDVQVDPEVLGPLLHLGLEDADGFLPCSFGLSLSAQLLQAEGRQGSPYIQGELIGGFFGGRLDAVERFLESPFQELEPEPGHVCEPVGGFRHRL